jgi:hypothetical protein
VGKLKKTREVQLLLSHTQAQRPQRHPATPTQQKAHLVATAKQTGRGTHEGLETAVPAQSHRDYQGRGQVLSRAREAGEESIGGRG